MTSQDFTTGHYSRALGATDSRRTPIGNIDRMRVPEHIPVSNFVHFLKPSLSWSGVERAAELGPVAAASLGIDASWSRQGITAKRLRIAAVQITELYFGFSRGSLMLPCYLCLTNPERATTALCHVTGMAVDHLDPSKKFVADNPGNVLMTCPSCNATKGNKAAHRSIIAEVESIAPSVGLPKRDAARVWIEYGRDIAGRSDGQTPDPRVFAGGPKWDI